MKKMPGWRMGKRFGGGGDTSEDYIVVTPAKNEENNLLDVADSLIKQTIKPKLWLIVDDGSTDGTPVITKNLEYKYNWIKTIRLPPRPRDITFHYAYVCKRGFDYIIEYCEKIAIDYEFIGLLDADTVLVNNYFGNLINEFKKDKNLGIASGGIYYNINGKLKWLKGFENLPAGTGRVWRKDCFFDTGGYLVEPSPDSISNVKAVLRGWKTRKFKHIIAVQKRWTSSAEGLWKGYKINGKMAYYLNKHPILVLLNTIYFATKKPHYMSLAFLYGYLVAFFKKEGQIKNKEIKDYYWRTRPRELIQSLLG